MAPRKRTTRQRKDNPRVAKLEAFLDDFDSEVKTRADQLMERFNQLLKDVDHRYHVALIKLPESVRQTTWLEHFKSEKQKSPVVNNVKKEKEEAAIVDSIGAIDPAVLLKSAKKMSKRKGGAKSASEDENTPSTTRKGKVMKKPRTTTKKAKALSVSQQNSSIRRSNRRLLATPANSIREFSMLMGPTPLVTPRFDPRLPKTPAVRVPRHKERVYSISVNGSPIAAGNEDIVINVPIGNGESIQLLASQMDSVDLSMLDEAAVRRIRQLQNRLTNLCGISE